MFRCLKIILLLLCLSAPLALYAEEAPVIYTIQRGDTLWGLSERFLQDPRHWPDLWSKNPRVTNPHLIFPGQLVRFRDGQLEIVEQPKEVVAEKGVEKAAEAVAVPEAVQEAKSFAVRGSEGWLLEQELESAGRIISGEHGRLILGEHDMVYTDLGSLHGGRESARYTALRKGRLIRNPQTGDRLGYLVLPLGSVELTKVTELNSRGVITRSFREIEPGDLLIPALEPPQRNVSLKAVSSRLEGLISASATGFDSTAVGDLVYLSLGRNQGGEPGNMLYIVREVKVEKMKVERYLGELPKEVVGALVLVAVGENSSTGLIIKSSDAIFNGFAVVSDQP